MKNKGILAGYCTERHLAALRAGRRSVLMLTHVQQASAGLIWCPLCYENRKGRGSHRGHLGYRVPALREESCMPLKKPLANNSSGRSSVSLTSAGTTLQAFPTLLEFLVLSTWEDGSPRTPGTLLLFVDGSQWKACLKDKTGPRVCFVTGNDLDTLLLSVEEGLRLDNLDWRADRPQGGQRR